ncbi:peptidyl-prolyl cis-trans isomerase [Ectothiorhodospira sp. B14B]|nr:peptidyl-prolyl cis-trans isomerase [Ectothiorhodospira lacustris]
MSRATLVTSKGDVVIELYSVKAPETVASFIAYAREGFYNNTIFHRVIPGFMIQGGGFNPQMQEKPTHEPIRSEANNGLSNKAGTIALARSSDPHSGAAQFFINVGDNKFLDFKSETRRGWGYTVFGSVIEGMDVVQNIANTPTGIRGEHRDVPRETVLIRTVIVD